MITPEGRDLRSADTGKSAPAPSPDGDLRAQSTDEFETAQLPRSRARQVQPDIIILLDGAADWTDPECVMTAGRSEIRKICSRISGLMRHKTSRAFVLNLRRACSEQIDETRPVSISLDGLSTVSRYTALQLLEPADDGQFLVSRLTRSALRTALSGSRFINPLTSSALPSLPRSDYHPYTRALKEQADQLEQEASRIERDTAHLPKAKQMKGLEAGWRKILERKRSNFVRQLERAGIKEGTNDFKIVMRAYDLAEEAHLDHRRKSGEPFFLHPRGAALLFIALCEMRNEPVDAAILAGFLLHDAIEDRKQRLFRCLKSKLKRATFNDIIRECGVSMTPTDEELMRNNYEVFGALLTTYLAGDVAQLVLHETKPKVSKPPEPRELQQLAWYYENQRNDLRAVLIKSTEHLHNLFTEWPFRADKYGEHILETHEYIMPALGNWLERGNPIALDLFCLTYEQLFRVEIARMKKFGEEVASRLDVELSVCTPPSIVESGSVIKKDSPLDDLIGPMLAEWANESSRRSRGYASIIEMRMKRSGKKGTSTTIL